MWSLHSKSAEVRELEREIEEDAARRTEREKEEMKRKVASKPVLKSIFERHFECLFCDKKLNRYKVKGRCVHLKECCTKRGSDIYVVAEIMGIERDVLDHPTKYEHKLKESQCRNSKKSKSSKLSKSEEMAVGMEVEDLSLFAMGGPKTMMTSNRGIKGQINEIESQCNDFVHRMNRKKRIPLNHYDEHIADTVRDLKRTTTFIERLQGIQRMLECKLERARQLKAQHGT